MHWSQARALTAVALERHKQLDAQLADALHRDSCAVSTSAQFADALSSRRARSTAGHRTPGGPKTATEQHNTASEPQYSTVTASAASAASPPPTS